LQYFHNKQIKVNYLKEVIKIVVVTVGSGQLAVGSWQWQLTVDGG